MSREHRRTLFFEVDGERCLTHILGTRCARPRTHLLDSLLGSSSESNPCFIISDYEGNSLSMWVRCTRAGGIPETGEKKLSNPGDWPILHWNLTSDEDQTIMRSCVEYNVKAKAEPSRTTPPDLDYATNVHQLTMRLLKAEMVNNGQVEPVEPVVETETFEEHLIA